MSILILAEPVENTPPPFPGAAAGVQVTPDRKLGRAVPEARRQGVPPVARRRLVTTSVDGSACVDSEEGVPPAAVSAGCWKGWTGQEEAAARVLQRAARGRSARLALLGRRQTQARVRLAAREIEERVKREHWWTYYQKYYRITNTFGNTDLSCQRT